MGPTIILDKSSLQALSKKELILLNKLFFVNIPPVLTIEILADLKKENSEKTLNENRVKEIANKLIQKDNAINVHYMDLLISSLLGADYSEERRTIVGGAKKVKDKDGRIGAQIIESKEQQAIKEWQKGNFSDAENMLASEWRKYSKSLDLEEIKKRWEIIKTKQPKCKDFNTLDKIAESWLNNETMQLELLFNIVASLNIPQATASQIFHRWETNEYKYVKDFAPYSYYCNKVEICFSLGLVYNLITTRGTNRIDSEYIYYLPFCNIFTSRDNFHKDFIPIFLAENQIFVDGDVLKADLKNIIEKLESENDGLNIDWGSNFLLEPPNDSKSFSYQMWKRFFPDWSPCWFYKKNQFPKVEKKLSDDLKQKVSTLENIENVQFEKTNDDDIDFIISEKYIGLDDQCICGSSKLFKDCCYR